MRRTIVRPVRAGELIGWPAAKGHGAVTRPAPEAGLLISDGDTDPGRPPPLFVGETALREHGWVLAEAQDEALLDAAADALVASGAMVCGRQKAKKRRAKR